MFLIIIFIVLFVLFGGAAKLEEISYDMPVLHFIAHLIGSIAWGILVFIFLYCFMAVIQCGSCFCADAPSISNNTVDGVAAIGALIFIILRMFLLHF